MGCGRPDCPFGRLQYTHGLRGAARLTTHQAPRAAQGLRVQHAGK